jgi:hypothetical protein
MEFQLAGEYLLSIRGFDGQQKVVYARTHDVDGAIVHSFVTDDPPAVDVFLVPEDLIGTIYFFRESAAV